MLGIAIVIGCLLGAIIGVNLPIIPYTYSSYLAISIIAALDTVFGGIVAVINKKFECNFINIACLSWRKIKCGYIYRRNCCIRRKNVQQFRNYKKILC